ncbi:unnamed protein product [Effrenium voratum]|uniref:Uncharacterized protein n=1 Tax=Effrenium voratum TaxID=2562239 RepID=A0AA36HZE3_9DINO|nr:unnamed protein product [Effrenium voratum]
MLLSPQVKVSYSARNCTRCCASRKDELGPGVLSQNRRWFLSVGLGVLRFSSSRASARRPTASQVIPLRWEAGGFYLQFCLDGRLTEDKKPKRIYAVADTGSPFLLVAKCLRDDCPAYCAEVGCFEGEGQPSGDPDSFEGYASGLVEVQWRSRGRVSFPDANNTTPELSNIRFGVQGRVIGFGGTGKAVFFGLIRDHMSDVKPSFLEQTPFKVLTVDLRHPGRETLELAAEKPVALGEASRTIKLEDPQRWGDPVKHYCAVATVRIAGQAIAATNNVSPRKVLAIFDTGTTGASMTRGLYDAYLQLAKHNSSSGMSWSQARRMEVVFDSDVTFEMQRGKHSAYGIGLDLVTPIDEMAWAGVGPSESIANYKVPGGAHDERPFEAQHSRRSRMLC